MAQRKYLNETGLSYFWGKIKETFLGKTDTAYRSAAMYTGQVDSSSTSTAFVANINCITDLYNGLCILLRNGVVTSASGYTLNVNNLGALPVYNTMTGAVSSTGFTANTSYIFVYNENRVAGGCWDAYTGYYASADGNSIGYQIRTNSSTLPASDKGYRYRLWFTSADGTKFVPANTSTSTNATAVRTPNTRPIDPFGEIFYCSSTTIYDVGSNLGTTNRWQQYVFALGYSFNTTGAALTLTYPAPVYIKCLPQSTGGAVLQGYTQSLPTTDDGFIYIFLGIAYSATNVELFEKHPVYVYKNNGIRIYNEYANNSSTVNGHTVNTDVPSDAVFTDTKNTAGSTDTSSKIFLIGATSQAANPQTYSHDTAYVGTDGKLYSGSKVVLVGGSNASSNVTITPSTTDVYSMTSAGSVTAGTANVPTVINTSKFSGGSFSRGAFNGGSFTQGIDSFTQNTPTVINTSKFSGGSFSRGAFNGGSFTQGVDSFTQNTPTVINTSKFSGGSFSRGAFSQGSLPTLTFAMDTTDTKKLKITFGQGTLPTHDPDTFTAASFQSGFYTAGTKATFTQGTDSFMAATHEADTFTAASFQSGFYTAGTKATFTQGTDSFMAATHEADTFTAASLQSGFYTAGTAGTPTSVTLPGRSAVIKAWTGYSAASAAAQTFTGSSS